MAQEMDLLNLSVVDSEKGQVLPVNGPPHGCACLQDLLLVEPISAAVQQVRTAVGGNSCGTLLTWILLIVDVVVEYICLERTTYILPFCGNFGKLMTLTKPSPTEFHTTTLTLSFPVC